MDDFILNSCLKNLKNLNELKIYSAQRLTSQTLQNIPKYCPKLEIFSLFYALNLSDYDLRVIIEGLPLLTSFTFHSANITNRSIKLIIEKNKVNKIIHWGGCERLTWFGKLLYLQEICLPQLLNSNHDIQLIGIQEFSAMINSESDFPINQYISMGVFDRIDELLAMNNSVKEYLELCHHSIMIFDKLITLSHTRNLIQCGFIDTMLDIKIEKLNSDDCNIWLRTFLQYLNSHNCCKYLISKGILSKLMNISFNMKNYANFRIYDIIVKLSAELHYSSSLSIEHWFPVLPFLLKALNIDQYNCYQLKILTIIMKIALYITHISQLNKILIQVENEDEEKEKQGIVEWLIYLLSSNVHVDTNLLVLKVIHHLQSIDSNFIDSNHSLKERLLELEYSRNHNIVHSIKKILHGY